MRIAIAGLVGLVLLAAAPARAAEDSPLERALTCHALAFSLVEVLILANDNLEETGKAAADDAQAGSLAGLVRAGDGIIQRRALGLTREIEDCLRKAEAMDIRDPAVMTAVVWQMAVELDAAIDAVERYRLLYARYKADFDLALAMEEELGLLGYGEFAARVSDGIDRIEPLFLKLQERSTPR